MRVGKASKGIPMSFDEFDHAVACGLTKRCGPSEVEVQAMPAWRRLSVSCLPTDQRWRLSSLAPEIRAFEKSLERS